MLLCQPESLQEGWNSNTFLYLNTVPYINLVYVTCYIAQFHFNLCSVILLACYYCYSLKNREYITGNVCYCKGDRWNSFTCVKNAMQCIFMQLLFLLCSNTMNGSFCLIVILAMLQPSGDCPINQMVRTNLLLNRKQKRYTFLQKVEKVHGYLIINTENIFSFAQKKKVIIKSNILPRKCQHALNVHIVLP